MPSVVGLHYSAIMVVWSVLVVGCVAPPEGTPKAPPQADVNQRLPTVPPVAGKLTADPDEPRTPRENAVPRALQRTATRSSEERSFFMERPIAVTVMVSMARAQTVSMQMSRPSLCLLQTYGHQARNQCVNSI
jgi:hypothetical protein